MEKKIKFSFTVYRLSSNECVFNILKFESEAQFTYWLAFVSILGELVQRKLYRWSIDRNWASETLLNQ